MGALADIFAAVRLQLDGTGFEAQATALATKSGQNVGDKMSQQLNTKLKKAVGGAIGAGAGLALGAMASGALELDAATRQLQADTGMTADEADRARKALAGMYGRNLQGFDAIGGAMAAVHNDLGLVGDAADAMTGKFLKLTEVTKQDTAAAVKEADDTLDAWNLTADHAGEILDKLTVSHQRWGGEIGANQQALAAMAPAMQAANMSIDDGIALLNLFNASGIDASKAPAMLAKAVKQLKPGQNLNDLIAQLGKIEDPTLRAQKAMSIFGAKTGIAMAQAIRPGTAALTTFGVSMDDAAGATEDAAKVIENDLGNRAKLALKGFQATLAEVGTNMGDLLMVAAMLGPGFTKGLLTGLGGIAGVVGPMAAAKIGAPIAAGILSALAPGLLGPQIGEVVIGSLEAAAPAAGVSIAGSLGAILAGIALPVVMFDVVPRLVGSKPGDELAAGRALGLDDTATQTMLSVGLGNMLQRAADDAVNSVGERAGRDFAQTFGDGVGRNNVGERAGRDIGQGFTQELTATGPSLLTAAERMAGYIRAPIVDAAKLMRDYVLGKLRETVAGFRSAGGEISSLASETAAAIYGPQRRQSALTANAREQHAQREILASHKSTAAQKADARARLLALQQEGLGIRIEMAGRGELTGKAYRLLISDLQLQAKSGNKEVAASAKLALAELARLKAAASAIPNLPAWLRPPGSGQSTSTEHGHAGGGAFSAGDVLWTGERGPELNVYARPGYTLTHQEAMQIASGAAGGGFSPTITIYNPEPRPAEADIGRVLRRVAALGMS